MTLKRKVAREWTVYDLGLPFVRNKPKLKKLIKRLSSKKMRKYLKTI